MPAGKLYVSAPSSKSGMPKMTKRKIRSMALKKGNNIVKKVDNALRFSKFQPVEPNRAEIKFYDEETTTTSIGNGQILYFFRPVQGDTATTRTGNRVTVTEVAFKLHYYISSLATSYSAAPLRVILVYDKEPNGTATAITDVLTGATPTSKSFRNLLKAERFITLYDKTHVLGQVNYVATTTWATGVTSRYLDVVTKCNLPVQYLANAGTAADVQSGLLSLIILTEGGGGDSFDVTYRTRFKDA